MSYSNCEQMISDSLNFIYDRLPSNSRNDPEWLKSLQGDSPLLGRSEWEYIAVVRDLIIREAKPSPNIPHDQRLRNKLSVMKNNFEEIVTYLRRNSQRKDFFVETYPSWRSFRDMSITQLKDIAKAINNNRQESAEARRDGSSMSLVGGLMCLIPGIGALRMAGTVLMGIGSLGTLATSYLELEQFRKKIKEAEKIMLQDKKYSEKLWNWMNDVSHIEEAYNVIKNMAADMDLKRIVSDLHGFFKKIDAESTKNKRSLHTEELIMLIQKAMPSLKLNFGMITEIADAIAMLTAHSMLYERHRPTFNLAFEAFKSMNILYTVGVVATTAKMASLVNASSKGSTLSTLKKSGIGIGIALNIITIIQASNDMESTSKEAAEIENAAEKLKKEAEVFKKIYDAVNHVSAG